MAISHSPDLNLTIPTARFDLPLGPVRMNEIRVGDFEASTDGSPRTIVL